MAVYAPQTPEARKLLEITDALNSAQHQWETYAAILGSAYTSAFALHDAAVGEIGVSSKESAEAAYCILSLFCVSIAGGTVGGVMAPWVAKQASLVGGTLVSTALSQGAQIVTERGVDLL